MKASRSEHQIYNPDRSFEAGISSFSGVVSVKANGTDNTMSSAPFALSVAVLKLARIHSLVYTMKLVCFYRRKK